MDDGSTHVTKFPYVGASCKVEVAEQNMVLTMTEPFNPATVEHCPDFDERMTLKDGRTRAVAYPNAGWNCSREWSF